LLLRADGHRVETATNPLYALTLASEFSAEVVLLDIGMPVMDGYQVLARLKRNFPRARFYAITGRSESETAVKHWTRDSTDISSSRWISWPSKKSCAHRQAHALLHSRCLPYWTSMARCSTCNQS
jgi:CheY-like chemotaxis protein